MIHLLCRTKRDSVRFHHASQNGMRCRTYELFISEIFPLTLLDPSWPWVTESMESKTVDKGGATVQDWEQRGQEWSKNRGWEVPARAPRLGPLLLHARACATHVRGRGNIREGERVLWGSLEEDFCTLNPSLCRQLPIHPGGAWPCFYLEFLLTLPQSSSWPCWSPIWHCASALSP